MLSKSHRWDSGIGTLAPMRTRDILAANLAELMLARPDLNTLKKITDASHGKLSNGKLDRIRRATHATDVDTLAELAEVFGLQTWQLLVADLNPKGLPQMVSPELLSTLRSLVLPQPADVGRIPDDYSDQTVRKAHQPGTKKPLGRLPGENIRTGRDGDERSETDRHGAIPPKRGGRRS